MTKRPPKPPAVRKRKRAVKLIEPSHWRADGIQRFEMPIRTVSENAYRREHWSAIRRRTKTQRAIAAWLLSRHCNSCEPPMIVTLTRLAPRLLDDDNLRGSLKSVRDSVAAWLGIDDGNALVRYHYGQQKHGAYGVLVDVRKAVA